MLEKSPQQFAKDKRKVLEQELPTDLPYDVLRQTYYDRTQKWFMDNITSRDDFTVLLNKYTQYVDWCVEQALVPLKVKDYNHKIDFIRNRLTAPTPTPDILAKARNIWAS